MRNIMDAFVRLFVLPPMPPHLEGSERLGEQNVWEICLMSHYSIKGHRRKMFLG